MIRKALALTLAFLIFLMPMPLAWSQGPCSVFRTWNTGDSLTAGDLNSSFSTVGVTNMEFSCLDDLSGTVAEMQTTADPYASQTESLATTGAGEIQRLRFMIQRLFGLQDWYRHDANVNFAHAGGGVNVQGSGVGRHVTAVGLHVWSGWRSGNPTPALFPSLTSDADHWTGFAFPLAGHVSVVIGDENRNGGAKGGIEMLRLHAQGIQLHHTAAIRFTHSAAGNTQWQYPNITALSLSRGLVSAAGNEAAGRDTLLFGHAGTVLQMAGYGASHIALGTGSYLFLGSHRSTSMTPVAGATYGDSLIKAYAYWNGGTANTPVLAGFNVSGVTDVEVGRWIVFWIRPFASANYLVMATGSQNCPAVVEDVNAAHVNIRAFQVATGVACDMSYVSVIAVGSQ